MPAIGDDDGMSRNLSRLSQSERDADAATAALPILQATSAFRGPKSTRGLTIGQAPSDAFDEELRCLLRSRLILTHILVFSTFMLLGILSFAAPGGEANRSLRPDRGDPWQQTIPIGECVIGLIVLSRNRGLSLRSLRLWELVHYGIFASYNGLVRFEMLAYVGNGNSDPAALEIAFSGAVSMNAFVGVILSYGVLIPNTRRRSLIVIALFNLIPMAATIAAAAINPALQGVHLLPILIQSAVVLLFPSAIAIFAASRAISLQRRAFDAERRAEQIGQYTLKRKLGEGGMGEVYLAEHALLKRPCALKFIRPELSSRPANAARFAKEVAAVTSLTHFNTVRVYDYGRAADRSFYFVMEYLDGPTLDDLVQNHGPLPPGRVVYLLRQLCGALAEAHAAGLVHRDLKPGNVIVARLGGACDVAKLLDFGLVLDEAASVSEERLTQAGVVLGTPAYMSPEQAAGEPVDARGDVYALGALAYYLVSGRPPFENKSALKLMAAHRSTPAPPLEGCPRDLAAVIARCLAKDPNERPQSMADLERELSGCDCASEWSAARAVAWWAVQDRSISISQR